MTTSDKSRLERIPRRAEAATRVAVITPTLNADRYLESCLQSVRSQHQDVTEHIVVDGGSTDRTLEILSESAWSKLRCYELPGSSASEALNFGLDRIAAPCLGVGVLNADDEYVEGALRSVRSWFLGHPAVSIVSGGVVLINSVGDWLGEAYPDRFTADKYARGLVRVVHPATFVRWEPPLRRVRYPERNQTCWDGEYLYRAARKGASFGVSSELWARFRIHHDSISQSDNRECYLKDRTRIFQLEFGRKPHLLDRLLLKHGARAKELVRRVLGQP